MGLLVGVYYTIRVLGDAASYVVDITSDMGRSYNTQIKSEGQLSENSHNLATPTECIWKQHQPPSVVDTTVMAKIQNKVLYISEEQEYTNESYLVEMPELWNRS